MKRRFFVLASGIAALVLSDGCRSVPWEPSVERGHLLIVGGGLDDDVRAVYERFIRLSSAHGSPRIVLALTATDDGYDSRSEMSGKMEALRAWAPSIPVDVVRRETSSAETVAAFDRATGVLFTGGDQGRIVKRYRPGGRNTPEWLALKRVLSRGGVIAGCSAGDMMMGDVMLLRGDNSRALGAPRNERTGEINPLQMGRGMGFLPWAVTDSHFFERDRVARLVAALESSGNRLGIGVGENAAVEVDLARGELVGVSESDSLLIDAVSLQRDGNARLHLRARLVRQGDRLSLSDRLRAKHAPLPARPTTEIRTIRVASPSQNRQLAMWRLFKSASVPGSGVWEIIFNEGWRITAWPDGHGEVIFDVAPASGPRSPDLKNILDE